MTSKLNVEVISRLAAADAIAPAWRDLLTRTRRPTPMQTPLWLLSWWRVFSGVGLRALRLVAVRESRGGPLVGLAPLLRRVTMHRRIVPIRRIELLGTGEDEADEICSDYVGILAEDGREVDVANAVAHAIAKGELGTWDDIVLSAMRGDDQVIDPLICALTAEGVAIEREESGRCPYIPLEGTWDDYLKSLGSDRRYLVTRSLRDLGRIAENSATGARSHGRATDAPPAIDPRTSPSAPPPLSAPAAERSTGETYRVFRASTRSEFDEGRRILITLHGERWSEPGSRAPTSDAARTDRGERGERDERERGGVFASKRFMQFHDLVMPKLFADSRDGAIELSWLVVGDRPVAAIYNILYDGRLYFYQSGRALDVPKGLRPGIALHALAIRRAIDEGRREYDFLNGAAQYKQKLSLASRPLLTLRGVAPHRRAQIVARLRIELERAAELKRRLRPVRAPIAAR